MLKSYLKGVSLFGNLWWGPKLRYEKYLGYELDVDPIRRWAMVEHNRDFYMTLHRRMMILLAVFAIVNILVPSPYNFFAMAGMLLSNAVSIVYLYRCRGAWSNLYIMQARSLMADGLLTPLEECPRMLTDMSLPSLVRRIAVNRLEGKLEGCEENYREFVRTILLMTDRKGERPDLEVAMASILGPEVYTPAE